MNDHLFLALEVIEFEGIFVRGAYTTLDAAKARCAEYAADPMSAPVSPNDMVVEEWVGAECRTVYLFHADGTWTQ